MSKVTNEQKLYVLLDNIRDKSEYEQEIWGIIYDHVSPDNAWKEGAKTKHPYIDYAIKAVITAVITILVGLVYKFIS